MPADADRGYDTNLPELTDFQREVLVSNDTALPFCLPFSQKTRIRSVQAFPETWLDDARHSSSPWFNKESKPFDYESLPATYSAKLTRLAKL